MEPTNPTAPPRIDYSRCVAINIDGLAAVLSGFNESIQALQDRLDAFATQIQQ